MLLPLQLNNLLSAPGGTDVNVTPAELALVAVTPTPLVELTVAPAALALVAVTPTIETLVTVTPAELVYAAVTPLVANDVTVAPAALAFEAVTPTVDDGSASGGDNEYFQPVIRRSGSRRGVR